MQEYILNKHNRCEELLTGAQTGRQKKKLKGNIKLYEIGLQD